LLSFLKIKIHTIILLPAVFYEWETWSLTLREECRLRVFENRVLSNTSGPKRNKIQGNGKYYTMRRLMICSPHQIIFR
jgi:hypothetical protein